MRVRTLFIGSLGLSLAIHALILFTPSSSISKPASRNEIYRAVLLHEPIKTAGNEEPETTPVSSVVQKKPTSQDDPANIQTAVKKENVASDDATERENDQIIRESEEISTPVSQPRQEPDPVKDKREEVRTGSSGHPSNSWSPGAPRSSIQLQRNDHQRILSELSRLLQERLQYPEAARRKGIEGAVAVSLTLNTNGKATDVLVSESSGSHILDRAAVRAISDIFPYSDPPDKPLHFTIPVTYRLTESE